MQPLARLTLGLVCIAAVPVGAQTAQPPPAGSAEEKPPAESSTPLVWSLGLKLRSDDLRQPGHLGLRPIIGLRWGRWRTGPVDGDSWYRFGQVRTDNTLTYDWLDTARFRTSLSASIVNLQKDTTLDALEPGFKTVRGKATLDYLGWSHWSLGLVLTQDLLDRGVGTTLAPSLTYRQALDERSTLLLSQSVTWASAQANATNHRLSPDSPVHQGAGWSSLDSSLVLRQRWRPHTSWYAQLHRSQQIGTRYPTATEPQRTVWSAQLGVVYFSR